MPTSEKFYKQDDNTSALNLRKNAVSENRSGSGSQTSSCTQ